MILFSDLCFSSGVSREPWPWLSLSGLRCILSPIHQFRAAQTPSSLSSLLSFSLVCNSPQFDFSSLRFCDTIQNHEVRCSSSGREARGLDPKVGVSVYKPKSYEVLVTDAANSLIYALEDGKTRLEIEFPLINNAGKTGNIFATLWERDVLVTARILQNIFEVHKHSEKGSSDEFIDANIQLVLVVVRKLQERKGMSTRIVFPDNPEKRRACQLFKTALDTIEGITIGPLDDVAGGAVTI